MVARATLVVNLIFVSGLAALDKRLVGLDKGVPLYAIGLLAKSVWGIAI
jgi:hypothetical protein